MGIGNTLVTQNDPAAFGRLPGFFDIIVADAPCSGRACSGLKTAVREWSVRKYCSLFRKTEENINGYLASPEGEWATDL